MNNLILKPICHLSLLMLICSAFSASAVEVDTDVLNEQLFGTDLGARARALAKSGEILVEIKESLLSALEEEVTYLEERRVRARAGIKLDRHRDPNFAATLTEIVIELHEPRALPLLIGVLGSGYSRTFRALAEFGEPAVNPLVEVALNSNNINQQDQAMVALRCLVEHTNPLSDDAMNSIRRVAEVRMNSPVRLAETGIMLRKAIDLAVAVNDQGLRKLVELISYDSQAVRRQGISIPERIEKTQKHASDRLAGVPARQRCVI